MTKQEAIEVLKSFVEGCEDLKLILVMDRKSVTEICSHYGTWNGHDFTCASHSYWRAAEVESETDTEDFYNLLVAKDLAEMSSGDFRSMSLGEASDANTDISEIEWDGDEPDDDEKEENDYSDMDLYWDSNIGDCDIEFDSGSVVAIKFEVGGESYTIE